MNILSTLLVDSVSTELSKKKILDTITFDIREGEVLALVGHNGAGKSTLIKTITGVLNKSFGRIVINGYDQDEDLLSYKQYFSYLPEEPLLLSELTVLQHFQLYGKSYQINETSLHERIDDYVTGFELTDKLNEYPESLSKGMRQKVQTICAFLPDTPLLIIDEPFMGLDVYAIAYFEELLKDKITEGTSVLITSHQLDRVKNIADRYVLLQEGKLVQSGSIDDFDTITRRTE
ncbi:ABC transporter ATP-binding protein [Cerasibacillus sp.]|uniref:ABC transporter ATP-binding protein n=1 Tax=Cerasibacillus sp. TaxID=2498711 RepID=UPI0039C8866D